MEIGYLTPQEWPEYKKIRLEALKNDPAAFAVSFEEESGESDEYWRSKLIDAKKPNNQKLFAISNKKAIGMAGFYQEKLLKMKHTANIIAVYVSPQFRGQGIGKKLFSKLLEKVKENREITRVSLCVNTEQLSAVKLYKSFGFEIVGTIKESLKIDNHYYDEYMMDLYLNKNN